MANNLDKKVDELELSIRAMNALKLDNINTVYDIIKNGQTTLLRLPNFGIKSLNDVRSALDSMGLNFDMDIDAPTNGKAQTNGDAEKTPTLFQVYNKEVMFKAEQVAFESLNYIKEKKKWDRQEVDTIFGEHRKIINAYENALLNLFV